MGTYYPEIDEIDRQYADYKEKDVTDYGIYNKAHIENMVHKYKRLALGSVTPENIAKYKAKVQECEGKLGGNVDNNSESGMINKKDVDLSEDNQRIREWYVENVSDIANRIDRTKPFENQVEQAYEFRNKYKKEARMMMADKETVERLEKLKPAPSFEQLTQDKMSRKNMTREEALNDILKTASKTNKEVNKEFNL